MTERKKTAYDMLMEFPQELSLHHDGGKPYTEGPIARLILGTDELDIVCDENTDFETRGVLIEISPQAAAKLAEICKTRGLEIMEARENKTRLPLAVKAPHASHFGIMGTLLPMQDDEDLRSEFFIDAERAQKLREDDVSSLDGFRLELDYAGMLSVSAEEPYGVYVTATLDAHMLEQIAAWQPEENAGMSPS